MGSVLAALSMLQHLDLSCTTHVDDVKPLSSCAELLSCDISWTSVKDLMPLTHCSKLQVVDALGCEELLPEGVADLQRTTPAIDSMRDGNGGDYDRGRWQRVQLRRKPTKGFFGKRMAT